MILAFECFLIISFALGLVANVFFLIKIRKLDKAASRILNEISDCLHVMRQDQIEVANFTYDKINQVDRRMNGIKTSQAEIYAILLSQNAKAVESETIKPNNWDSMKSVFNRPIRLDNERD